MAQHRSDIGPSDDLRSGREPGIVPPPGEQVQMVLYAGESEVRVTERRLQVSVFGRVRLDIPIADVRRMEFDVEGRRLATLVIVPQSSADEAQVLTIARVDIPGAVQLVAFVAERLP